MRTCVVCLEMPCAPGPGRCSDAGCRGRSDVCGACFAKLTRCVYCRESLSGPAAPGPALVVLLAAWLAATAWSSLPRDGGGWLDEVD